jgi:hypothetical protein
MDANHCRTLPFQCLYDIKYMAAAPDGSTLTLVDTQNNIMVVELGGNTVVCQVRGKFPIADVSYSPDGCLLAMCRGNQLVVYRAPGNEFSLYYMKVCRSS